MEDEPLGPLGPLDLLGPLGDDLASTRGTVEAVTAGMTQDELGNLGHLLDAVLMSVPPSDRPRDDRLRERFSDSARMLEALSGAAW